MGSRIQAKVPTFKYEFADGDPSKNGWVEMKTSIRLGDRDAINSKMVVPVQAANKKTGEMEYTGGVKMDTSRANVSTLLQVIVAWGGPAFETDGKADEINEANIAGLSDEDAQELLKALNARNPQAVGPKDPAGSETTAGTTSSTSKN